MKIQSSPVKRRIEQSVVIPLLVAASALLSPATAAEPTALTFVWHEGACADMFYSIAKDYPDKSVKVVASLVPYGPQWHKKIAAEFAVKGDGFDIAMWDSQDAAAFAGAGHAYSINRVFQESKTLRPELFERASLARYGEYPDGSGKFWGLPVNQDAFGMVFRKDLFQDPKEQAAFKARYGRELKVPQTYQDAKQVAEFFTRPEKGLFGWGQMGGSQYDFAPPRLRTDFYGPMAVSFTTLRHSKSRVTNVSERNVTSERTDTRYARRTI